MSIGLLLGHDDHVASWTYQTWKMAPMKFDRALGLVEDGMLIGSVLFQCWNGYNVEVSYYGLKPTLRPGIIRCLAQFILATFNPSRITVTTRKKNKPLMRSLQRFGFRLEGTQRRFYGIRDCNRNTGVRFVMFRERLIALARFEDKDADHSAARR